MKDSSVEPELLTTKDVAHLLSVSESFVKERIADGALPVYRLGRAVRVSRSDLDAYLATVRDGRSAHAMVAQAVGERRRRLRGVPGRP